MPNGLVFNAIQIPDAQFGFHLGFYHLKTGQKHPKEECYLKTEYFCPFFNSTTSRKRDVEMRGFQLSDKSDPHCTYIFNKPHSGLNVAKWLKLNGNN